MSNFLQDLLHLAEYTRLNFTKQFGTDVGLSTNEREALDRLAAIDTLAVGDNAIVGPAYSTPAQAAARALVVGGRHGRVVLAPVGADTEDWTRFGTVAPACASGGYDLALQGKTYVSATKAECKPNLRLHLSGATIGYDYTPSGLGNEEDESPFYCSGGHLPANVAVTDVLGVVGATSISVDTPAAFAVGDMIWVRSAVVGSARVGTFQVIAKPGGNVLTLDAPLDYPFGIGSTVRILAPASQCRNIMIDGGNAKIQPRSAGKQCDRALEFIAAIDCLVSDITADGTGGTTEGLFGYDLGSIRSGFERIKGDSHGGVVAGFSIESSRDCWLRDCYWSRSATGNYLILSSTNWRVDNCTSELGSVGFIISSVTVDDTYGCRRGTMTGGTIRGAGVGIQLNDGSSYNRFQGVTIENSTYYAVELGANGGAVSGGVAHDNEFHGCNVRGGAYAYYCFRGSGGNKIIGGKIEDCTNVGVIADGAGSSMLFFGVGVINRGISGNVVSMFQAQNSAYMFIGGGSTITTTHAAGGNHPAGVHVNTGASIDIDGLTVTMAANNGYGIIAEGANSVLRVGDYAQIGGEQGIYLSGNTATVWVTGQLRLVGVTTPFSLNGGAVQAQSNVGMMTTNGAGAGSIAFTQCNANTHVRLYDGTTGAVVASAPTITAGTSMAWAGLTINHVYYTQLL